MPFPNPISRTRRQNVETRFLKLQLLKTYLKKSMRTQGEILEFNPQPYFLTTHTT